MIRALALSALACAPLPAAAHPHVFVEAGVTLVMDEANRLTAVRLTWTYDEFFSLMLTADLGVDTDGDLVLTEADREALAAGVLDWPENFGGDLSVTRGDATLALAPPVAQAVDYVDGRIVETHTRPLAEPAAAGDGALAVQVFDPYYYVAYEVVGEIGLDGGTGCATTFQPADLNAAYELVDEALYGRPASDVGPEEDFPEVGHAFADTVRLSCPAPA